MSAHPKLQRTRNYSQFAFAKENREVNILSLKPQHKKLRKSMQQYGFLPAFPIMVSALNGRFVVKDGQHRLTFAKELGLDVYFVVDDRDIDIAEINQAQSGWSARDYANRWANAGRMDYRTGIEFADEYRLPIGAAFAMLAGTIVFQNIKDEFHSGEFVITSMEVATRVASCYQALGDARKGMRHANLLSALWACCHVEYFDEGRIIDTAQRRPEMLMPSGTRAGFLQMLEEVYNFARKMRAPLRFDAEQAMRERNPGVSTKPRARA